MRRWWHLLIVALVGASGAPRAEAYRRRPPPAPVRDPESRTLWGRIIDPNGDEVRALVAKARLAMTRADDARVADEDWAIDQRVKFYRDAYNLAAAARKLAPDNLEALSTFARAAEELGQTAEAIGALERAAKLGGERTPTEVAARLGALYLRMGEDERAIRWLQLAQGPVSGDGIEQVHAIVHLATALAARGQMTGAIHAIASALPDRPLGRVSEGTTMLSFALAVFYDRDEQRAAAFEVLDQMQVTMSAQYQSQVKHELLQMRFLPPEDLHYYRALLYESLDQYIEARAEWALYAAAGQPAFKARALDHIAAIDAQRRANPGPRTPQQIAPPRAIPRRLPRP